MKSSARLVPLLVWGFLGFITLSVVAVFLSSLLLHRSKPLPSYGDVPDFRLTNQLGQAVSLNSLQGHIWIADLIFTRCPGPCLDMSRKMNAIRNALPKDTSVKLISITADPAFDTPQVLKEYARQFEADPSRWQFLTGPKESIQALVTHGLKLAFQENPEAKLPEDQLIHSTRFVLVDGRGQLRGVSFEGTEAETVAKVVRAAEQLARER